MYTPNPINTSNIDLPADILTLVEKIAENTHDVWAAGRIAEGWTHGETRDDANKITPCLVPYCDLPESEKEYDRVTATSVLKMVIKMGYTISKKEGSTKRKI